MKIIFCTLILILSVSCTDSQFDHSAGADGSVFNIINGNIGDINLDNLVCDPFQRGEVSKTHGLKTSLYSVEPDTVDSVNGFFKAGLGVKSKQEIYFSNLNIPTRKFSLGFPTVTGDQIKKDNGEIINEWFALRAESELKLGTGDQEGWYELGILSDDGSKVYVKDSSGNYQLVIDNDGPHETKMGCGSKKFYMTKSTKLPIRIDYFQGPRYHISLVPLMRRVDDNTKKELYCGVKGNDFYFDSENKSAALAPYVDLIDNGWKAMTPDNWGIPGADTGVFNPCAEGDTVLMTNLKVDSTTDKNKITLTWKTDKEATSQVIFKNVRTGKKITVNGGNVLKKEHLVSLSIVNRFDKFEVTAVSITNQLGKVISQSIIVD